jgi:hypothetical protein
MTNARRIVAGGDFAFMRDSSAVVLVSELGGRFRLEHERVWKPGTTPLRPGVVFGEAMKALDQWKAESVCCDTHYIASVYEVTEDTDIQVVPFPSTQEGIARAFVRVRVLFGDGLIDLSLASDQLIQELKETTGRPTPSGNLQIGHKRAAGSHGDCARAFVAGMFALEASGGFTAALGAGMTGGARRMQRRDRHPDSTDPHYLTDLPREDRR